MKFKGFNLFFVLILILTLTLSACSSATKGNGDTGDKGKNNKEAVTLKLLSSHGQFNKGNYGYRQVQEFMKKHPNIKVEVTFAQGNNFNDTLLALASSNDLPDVFQPTTKFPLNTLVENDWVQPLDGLLPNDFKNRFPEGSFAEGINTSDSKIYSFPRIIGKKGQAFFYHTDLLKEAGLDPNQPPKTWAELLEKSKQIVKKIDGVYGLVIPLNDQAGSTALSLGSSLQPTLDTTGFDYQKGQYDFNSPNVVKAIDYLLQLKKEGVIHPNSYTQSLTDSQGVWANKQAAFMINAHHFVRVSEFELGSVKDYDVTKVPVPEEGIQYSQLATSADFNAYISSTTKHKKEAALLIDWLSSPEYFEKQVTEDLLLSPIPNLKEIINNPALENLAEVYEETVIERPIPESDKGAFEVKKIESTLPAPQPDFNQIVQGALVGELKDWKGQLKELTDAYNARFEQAIEKAKSGGTDVSTDKFTFPDFDGTKDYIQK
ncbi:sugar ABC transporter substrate-binding protein [Metabacillus fastidiosus]|uniref:ABC transporter substrate-binding protein n=1 Tax=Metabacillus fastidiosus TaxID=1458 RepID=UPI002E208480|nr:sugar ABC transporter substrate-binding protein [Metabacillus fastidiosus]